MFPQGPQLRPWVPPLSSLCVSPLSRASRSESTPPVVPQLSVPLSAPSFQSGSQSLSPAFLLCLSKCSRFFRLCVFPPDPPLHLCLLCPSICLPCSPSLFPISNSLLLPAYCLPGASRFHLCLRPPCSLLSHSLVTPESPSPPVLCPPPAPTDDLEAGDRKCVTLVTM